MKLTKLSLATLMAAGIVVTNAEAKTLLTDAIKDVDTTGFVYLRETLTQDGINSDLGEYSLRVNFEIPILDHLTANIGIDNTVNTTSGDFMIEQANFVYDGFENASIIVGEQVMDTPFTDTERGLNGDWDVNNAFGARVLANFKGIHVELASYGQTDGTFSRAGLYPAVTPTQSFQYASISTDIANAFNFSASFLNADNTNRMANFTMDGDIVVNDDLTFSTGVDISVQNPHNTATPAATNAAAGKIYLGAQIADIVDAKITYGRTKKENGIVNLDSNAKNAFRLQTLNVDGRADAEAVLVELSTNITDDVKIGAGYLSGQQANSKIDFDEGKISAEYQIFDNLLAEAFIVSGTDDAFGTTGASPTQHFTNAKVELRYDF